MKTTLRLAALAIAAFATTTGIASAQISVNFGKPSRNVSVNGAQSQYQQALAQAAWLLKNKRITPAQYQSMVQNISQTQVANGYNQMAKNYGTAAVNNSRANIVDAYNGRQFAQNDQVRAYNDRIRAAGEIHFRRSQARINDGIADGKELDNDLKRAQQHYAKRAMHDAYVASKQVAPAVNRARAARITEAKRPERLSSSQFDRATGTVTWPETLKSGSLAKGGETVQALLYMAARTNANDRNDLIESARTQIGSMKSQLKTQIRQLSPAEYVAARSFLESLDYDLGLVTLNNTTDAVAASY